MSKILIAYFSRKGNNYVNGSIKNLAVGNTEIAANILKDIMEGDLLKLDPAVEYSADYDKCTDEAKKDLRANARPELKNLPDTLNGYDTIYLGFPNYWGTMPMHVFTFLEKYDFTGKTIKPFCTHEGSGMGRSETDIKKLCPGAIVKSGLALHGGSAGGAKTLIERWI